MTTRVVRATAIVLMFSAVMMAVGLLAKLLRGNEHRLNVVFGQSNSNNTLNLKLGMFYRAKSTHG